MSMAAWLAVGMVREWWAIVVSPSAAHIASYHFGSHLAIGQGGWRYSNPTVYAWTTFAEAVAALATMPALWMTIVRRSRRFAYALVFICAAYAVLALVLGQIHWTTAAW